MSAEAYTVGRNFLHIQRNSDFSAGSLVDFGKGQAIRVHTEGKLYRQLLHSWNEMWLSKRTYQQQHNIFYAPQCVTMTRERFHRMHKEIQEQKKTWYVSWKSNGDRYALMITTLKYSSERMCVMVNRKMDMFLVELSCPLTYYDGTVLTGDLIRTSKTDFAFELDDVQCWRGIRVAEYCKTQRIQLAQNIVTTLQKGTLLEQAFRIQTKPWVTLEHLATLVETARLHYLLEEPSSSDLWREFWLDVPCPDGLIFQENEAPLGVLTVESIIKAKPKAARTRDYLTIMHKEDNSRLDLYSFVGKNLPDACDIEVVKQFMFQRSMWWRKVKSQSSADSLSEFSSSTSDDDKLRQALNIHTLNCSADALHQCIVEWAPDFDKGTWHPIKKRDEDKLYANHDSVLQAEERDFLHGPVSIDELVASWSSKDGQSARPTYDAAAAAAHFSRFSDLMNDLSTPSSSSQKESMQSDLNRALQAQWDQRNAVKQILPSFINVNLLPDAIFPTLTKYERPEAISTEAHRLSNNGDALIPIGNSDSVIEIAERTLLAGTLPCVIKRPCPNDKVYELQACHLDVQWNMCNNR